jgi:hypothetical protein
MTERYVFADVDLPFHVWMKEGSRWVLRERRLGAEGDGVSAPGETLRCAGPSNRPQVHR